MSIYLVALTEPDETAWSEVERNWPNRHHLINDRLAFVSPEGIVTGDEIVTAIGITVNDDSPNGIVVPVQNQNGVLPIPTVNWLQAAMSEYGR